MSKLQIVLAVIALFSAVISVSGLAIGPKYESYLCAARRNFSSGFFSCSEDCQLSHGAADGACFDVARIDRYNCLCGHLTGHPPRRAQQCIEENEGYRFLCDMDCKCNHGALSGHCDYRLNACLCGGSNPTNDGCPAYSFEHFRLLAQVAFKLKVGHLGPSWLYEQF